MNLWRRIRQWSGEPPMSYVPMLPVALLVTTVALLVLFFREQEISGGVSAGKQIYFGVVDEVRHYDAAQRCIVTLDSCKVELYVAAVQPELHAGDSVRFETSLTALREAVEPDEFDYAGQLRRRGVELSGYVPAEKFSVVQPKRKNLKAKLQDVALRTADLLDSSDLNDNTIVFLKAALLGDTREARSTIGPQFSAAGLAHVLALSGTHVATLYAVFTIFLFPLYLLRSRRLLVVCVTLMLWVYALLTGMTASVVRAVVMATCFGAGFVAQRSGSSFNSWLVAWTLLLAADSDNLLDVGFQMSFAATGAILLFMPRLAVGVGAHRRYYRWIIASVGLSVAAMIGSGAVAANHFHTLPLLFLVANLPVGLLLPLLLGGGFVLCVLLWVGLDARWLCECLNWLYNCVEHIADFVASVEWGQLRHVWFKGWCLLPYFVTLICLAYALWRYNSVKAWLATGVFGMATVISFLIGTDSRSGDEWFVTTAGGNTAIVWATDSVVRYLTPLEGLLGDNAATDAQKTLGNYLSRRGVDSLAVDNIGSDTLIQIGSTRIAYLYQNKTSQLSDTGKADYLIVGRQYRGSISAAVDCFKPDTVLLASEMHWRRRRQWIDTLSLAKVPCIWLRNHRFGVRTIEKINY